MSKFLKAMIKIGLVESDGSEEAAPSSSGGGELSMAEIDAILGQEAAESAPPAQNAAPRRAPPAQSAAPRRAPAPRPSTSTAPSQTRAGSETVDEGVPFETLYAQAGTPAASYSAEKLLRVLDGLKAMDPHVRKAAVLAMDAADDDWTVADAVLDAERKIQVLEDRKHGMAQMVDSMAAEAASDKAKRDDYLAQAGATIRQKITELEEALEKEMTQIAEQKAQIDAKLEAARGTLGRETVRLDEEIGRLREIPQEFTVSRPS